MEITVFFPFAGKEIELETLTNSDYRKPNQCGIRTQTQEA